MTEAEITDIFGPRCAEFDAGCAGCYVWRAHDEYAALVAAARKVTCISCAGVGTHSKFNRATSRYDDSECPACADLRALLETQP